MNNRREAIKAMSLGAGSAIGMGISSPLMAQEDDDPGSKDRENIMAAGLTKEEAECWSAIADAAGKFFALEELHPSDKPEVVTVVHVIQQKLLARPTYRKYMEISKRGLEKK